MRQPRPATVGTPTAAPGWARAPVVLPVLAATALLAGFLPSFSVGANVLVVLVGGIMCWLGLTGRLGRRAAPKRLGRGAGVWLLPALMLAVVELFAFSHPAGAYPTLSLLADPLLDTYPGRAVCFFGWLAAFWWLVRR